MRYFIFNLILTGILISSSCYAQVDKDITKVHQILHRQAADWNTGKLEKFMEGYWNSPELQFIGSSGVTKGYKNTLERYIKGYPDRKTMGKLSFDIISTDKLSKKSIMLVGKYTLKRDELDDASGYFLFCLLYTSPSPRDGLLSRMPSSA